MLAIDIIVYISSFLEYHQIGLLDKETEKEVYLNEINKEWYNKYYDYFIINKIRFPQLKYTTKNWKKEYIRIKRLRKK